MLKESFTLQSLTRCRPVLSELDRTSSLTPLYPQWDIRLSMSSLHCIRVGPDVKKRFSGPPHSGATCGFYCAEEEAAERFGRQSFHLNYTLLKVKCPIELKDVDICRYFLCRNVIYQVFKPKLNIFPSWQKISDFSQIGME